VVIVNQQPSIVVVSGDAEMTMAALEKDDVAPVASLAVAASTTDQLKYLADLTLELQQMARNMKLDVLAALLRCAHDEAQNQLRSVA
jgi:mannitol/fructose-specific phosphotransferase system IIA component (Ntr-type)